MLLIFTQACQSTYAQAMATKTATAGEKAARSGLLSRKARLAASQHQPPSADKASASASAIASALVAEGSAQPFLHGAAIVEHAYNSDLPVGSSSGSSGAGLMEALTRYSETYSVQEPAALSALREETLRMYAHSPGAARMLCDPLQGAVLRMLATITSSKIILELGAFTGYSAMSLCLGLEGDALRSERRVVTCEPDAAPRAVAKRFVEQSGLRDQIDVRSNRAADVLQALREDAAQPPIDLAFIDADKKQYVQYVRTLIGTDGGRPLLRDGALVVVDNTLWKGMVLAEQVHVVCDNQSSCFMLPFIGAL